MHLILTGAPCLVGSSCLHEMLVSKSVNQTSILTRRPVPMADGHAYVNVIIHKDFSIYGPDVLEKLSGAQGCVWALGISVNSVSKRFVRGVLNPFIQSYSQTLYHMAQTVNT